MHAARCTESSGADDDYDLHLSVAPLFATHVCVSSIMTKTVSACIDDRCPSQFWESISLMLGEIVADIHPSESALLSLVSCLLSLFLALEGVLYVLYST